MATAAGIVSGLSNVPGCADDTGASKFVDCLVAISGGLGAIGGMTASVLDASSDTVRGIALSTTESGGSTLLMSIANALGGVKVKESTYRSGMCLR
jgi:hypothetical protein